MSCLQSVDDYHVDKVYSRSQVEGHQSAGTVDVEDSLATPRHGESATAGLLGVDW